MIDKGKRMVSFFTDCLNNVAFDGITYTGSAYITGATIPQRTNQQGVVALNVAAVSQTSWMLGTNGSNALAQTWFGGGVWNFETSFNIQTLSVLAERFRVISGFGATSGGATETDGVFITYDEGGTANGTAASPNWQCVTVANSVRTLTTTTTAVTASAWNKLRIEINAAGTSASFYVNGTLLATHTTNIPLGSNSRFVMVKNGLAKALGVTNRALYVDYLGYENILTTPRT
jgi:hypothetical protein